MKQLSFSDAEYGGKRKRTRREVFLAEMHRAVPWSRLEVLIEPHYPKAGCGRRPYPLATMLRIHCLQQWYGRPSPDVHAAVRADQQAPGMIDVLAPINQPARHAV